jgi:tetratricopeptide (TPR) repeat protein
VKLGLLYLDRDRFDDAINEFTFVLASDPENAQVRFFLGTAYEEKGALPEAEATFRKIPEGDPLHREAMLHLAMLLSRQKKNDEAIEVVRKLRGENPGDVELMIFLAVQLEGANRYDEALAVATEATEKAPENPAAWFAVGVVQDKRGQLEQVIAAMEKVIALDPKHATALNYLGYTFADRNIRLPEAEQLVQRALEIRPDDGYFLDSLAWVHFRRGDYRRAEAGLLQALKYVPDDPVILEHLGDVLQAQGRNDEAAALFEKAIAKGHEKPDEVGVKLHRLRKAQPAGK